MIRLCAAALLCLFPLWATPPLAADERRELGNLTLEGVPEIPSSIRDRLRQYQHTRRAALRGWHPSGEGIIVSTRFGETSQVHWVKHQGGARSQLTFFDEPIGEVLVSPDPELDSFVFGQDSGGSERSQYYRFDLKTGRAHLLTDGESRNIQATLANAGDRMIFMTTQGDGGSWEVHLRDLADGGGSRPILQESGSWLPGKWSPDDQRVLIRNYVSSTESYPFILDLKTSALTTLHNSGDKASYSDLVWGGDGKEVFFSSDAGAEFSQLRSLDLVRGVMKILTSEIPWDVQAIAGSPDGRWMVFVVNQDGMSKLHLWEMPQQRPVELPALPPGVVLWPMFSPDSKHLGLTLVSAQTPGDAYVIDLATASLERWTFSEVGGLDTSHFTLPELVHYETFDEVDGKPRQIPAFYYRPPGDGPFPVMIKIHGGPEGQHFPMFDSFFHFLLYELGVAVVAPNVRGSSGYGKSFLELDNGLLREDALKDIGSLLDWIVEQPELDAKRVVVKGGSYGGYMVLASMIRFADRLRGGIESSGISNFVTFLENTEPYRQDLRRSEYGDERDPEMREFLRSISPMTRAKKITKPLLISQGLNDPRVPVSEAEQIFQAVKANGAQPWYILANDEGHGFRKKSNRDFYDSAVVMFLEHTLLDKKAEGFEKNLADAEPRGE